MKYLTLTQPDDWHVHLRDGDALGYTVAHTAAQFRRAIVMPNLLPPVTNTQRALAYEQRIRQSTPEDRQFRPLMTLYLTDNTTIEDIHEASQNASIFAIKYYPAGATTHSDSGVTTIANVYDVLEEMARVGLPLLVHGEVTDSDVDIFDRERVFIRDVLAPLLERIPELRVVLEHITTADAVDFVRTAGAKVAATITPQHLMFSRNALFQGGIRPHLFCLPILKRERHRAALVDAAISGSPKFFLGTDSAPHARLSKETECGCAGIFSAHAAIEIYAHIFETAGALEQLEAFASINGPLFYELPINQESITLKRETWTVPDSYPFIQDDVLVPLLRGQKLSWKLTSG